MAVKTGIPTVIVVARKLCKVIQALSPLIRKATNNNPDVIAALGAASLACEALELILEPYLVPGD